MGRDQEFGSQKGEYGLFFADSANKDPFVRTLMTDKYIFHSWYLQTFFYLGKAETAIPGTFLQKQYWHMACVETLSWTEKLSSQ